MTVSYDRLSGHDIGYLRRETAVQPLHFVLQLDVAGALSVHDVRRHLAGRLGRTPFLHRRLRAPLLTGRPVWVDDPQFALDRHVLDWGPVDDDDARDALLQLTMERLPRDRPLWRLHVARGPGDRTTLWLSVHHAVADGGLLSFLLAQLFGDVDAVAPHRARRGPTPAGLLVRGFVHRMRRRPDPRTPVVGESPAPRFLVGPVGPSRSFAAVTVPLSDVLAARRRTGATVNDLFLSAVTDALRSWLPGWADAPLPDDVTALVPRDVRSAEDAAAIGNRGWSMLVLLPIGENDPARRLERLQEQTSAGKALEGTSGTAGWQFDVALSNVRLHGPHAVAGAPVVGHRMSVPLQGTNRLVVVATSREDELTFSVTGEGEAFPDPRELAALVRKAIEDLP